MLSRMDDYPIHQTSEPLALPASTDRNVYDRYWWNGYRDDGAFYFGIGAARYPNLEIMDCGFSLVVDGVQHAFHASRRAPRDPTELCVGPFRIEILTPMKSLRIVLDDNETGLAGELLWTPRTASIAEGQQRARRRIGHMEATRFNQFGRWQGEIRYEGKQLRIDPARVLGTKDRSWGIRPVGDPAPPGAPPRHAGGVFFLWAPLHWPERCTHLCLFENEHGWPWHFDGMICPVYEDPSRLPPGVEDPGVEALAAGEHQIDFIPGTRRAAAARFTLITNDGQREEIQLDPVLCFRMKGIGYMHPEWGHGRWKGELAIGGESWKTSDLDELALENLHIQQVVMAKSGERRGIGVLEQIHLGPHRRYGFRELRDGATPTAARGGQKDGRGATAPRAARNR